MIDDEEKAGRIVPADFGLVRQDIPLDLGRSAVGGDGRTGSDVKKVCDGFDSGIEHESAGAGANVITLGRRGLQSVRREQTRHPKQRLAEAILDDTLVIREDQRFAVARVDMEIEQEAGAVVGRKTFESIGNPVTCKTVGG